MEAGSYRSLIVPVDLTQKSDRVLPAAHALARQGGLPMHLVTTISPGLDPERDEAELERRRSEFDSIVGTHVLPAHEAGPAVGEFAGEFPAPLFCLATHAHTAVGEVLLGTVSSAILRAGRIPAVVMGPHATVSQRSPAEHLVVCVDEFALRQPLVEDASSWIATFGGDLEVFEVVDDLRAGPSAERPPDLVRAADEFGDGDTATTIVASRDPVTAIIDEGTRRPGTVIAMASHLRHGLGRLAHGSTASEVVRRYPGFVLVVPQQNP